MLEDFENALVEPEWIKVSMTDNKVVNCLAITKEASGYRVAFIPEGDEFLLACNGTSGWCCIGVRGGAVDTFAAI